MASGPTIWCRLCGVYGSVKAEELRRPCTGDPTKRWTIDGVVSSTAKGAKQSAAASAGRKIPLYPLKSGRHPITRQQLPQAIPESEWLSVVHGKSSNAGQSSQNGSRFYGPREDMLARIRTKQALRDLETEPGTKRRRLQSKTPVAETAYYRPSIQARATLPPPLQRDQVEMRSSSEAKAADVEAHRETTEEAALRGPEPSREDDTITGGAASSYQGYQVATSGRMAGQQVSSLVAELGRWWNR